MFAAAVSSTASASAAAAAALTTSRTAAARSLAPALFRLQNNTLDGRLDGRQPRPLRVGGRKASSSTLALHCQRLPRRHFAAAAAPALAEILTEAELEGMLRSGNPHLLHLGAEWSTRSRDVGKAITDFATSTRSVKCWRAELDNVAEFVAKRAVKAVPTVFFIRAGKVQKRLDGPSVAELEPLLKMINQYETLRSKDADTILEDAQVSAKEAIDMAEELWLQNSANFDLIKGLYSKALTQDSAYGFRARLGLVRCSMEKYLKAKRESLDRSDSLFNHAVAATEALDELIEGHQDELFSRDVREDGTKTLRFIAHATLLIDAWAEQAVGPENEVLQAYANAFQQALPPPCLLPQKNEVGSWEFDLAGQIDKAFTNQANPFALALQWYKMEAIADPEGLVDASQTSVRLIPDHPALLPHDSVFSMPLLETPIKDGDGPSAPRAMLRRLLAAFDPVDVRSMWARAEFEVLLDTKAYVPFHTREPHTRRGGAPRRGMGTGSGDGYSTRYWITWGRGTFRPNSRKMGSPHCDKND